MSHTIYTTEAIILKRVATGEADVTLWILTEDLGIIVARAQGARKEVSKMRSHLQVLDLLSLSVVKGRMI